MTPLRVISHCRHWGPALIIAASLAFQAWIALVLFRSYPFSMDEYGHWYQAGIFLQGRLYLEFPAKLPELIETHVLWVDGRLFSKYPPGYSGLLALGEYFRLGALVNPVIAAVTLVLAYALSLSLLPRRLAILVLLLLATSPYFMAYSASFFSHSTALLLTVAGFYFLRKYQLSGHSRHLGGLGTVCAFYIWVRPVDALCFTMLAGLFLLCLGRLRRDWPRLLLLIVCIGFSALLYMRYQGYLLGTTMVVHHDLKADFAILPDSSDSLPLRAAAGLKTYIERITSDGFLLFHRFYLLPVGLFTVLGALLLGWWRKTPQHLWRNLFAAHFLLLVLVYNFHPPLLPWLPTWPQYGMRYWYAALYGIVVLAVMGLSGFKLSRRTLGIVTAVALLTNGATAYYYLNEYKQRFNLIHEFQTSIQEQCPAHSIVVLHQPQRPLPDFVIAEDLKRNPFRQGERLYVWRYASPELLAAFPDYSLCHWVWQPRLLPDIIWHY